MYQGEKIGIVGRTGNNNFFLNIITIIGAGKSSFTLGISKIIDMTEGYM